MFENWQRYTSAFPSGFAEPYAVLSKPASNSIFNETVQGELLVKATNNLLSEISLATNIPAGQISGPTWVNGKPLDKDTSLALLFKKNDPVWNSSEACLSRFLNLYQVV